MKKTFSIALFLTLLFSLPSFARSSFETCKLAFKQSNPSKLSVAGSLSKTLTFNKTYYLKSAVHSTKKRATGTISGALLSSHKDTVYVKLVACYKISWKKNGRWSSPSYYSAGEFTLYKNKKNRSLKKSTWSNGSVDETRIEFGATLSFYQALNKTWSKEKPKVNIYFSFR